MTHVIVLWKWHQENGRSSYNAEHVNTFSVMLKANIHATKCRIVCVTDDPALITECETFPLWDDAKDLTNPSGRGYPSCFRRLRLYDPKTQSAMGIKKGDRIVSIDLDGLVVGALDELLSTQGRFVGWELKGAAHPKVFNGSFQMFTAGDLDFIWNEFDPQRSPLVAADAGFRGSDQAWLSYRLIGDAKSIGLKWPDVSSYPLSNKISGVVDKRTRLIFFHGSAKPWHAVTSRISPWVGKYWNGSLVKTGHENASQTF